MSGLKRRSMGKKLFTLDVLAHAFNASTREAEEGRSLCLVYRVSSRAAGAIERPCLKRKKKIEKKRNSSPGAAVWKGVTKEEQQRERSSAWVLTRTSTKSEAG